MEKPMALLTPFRSKTRARVFPLMALSALLLLMPSVPVWAQSPDPPPIPQPAPERDEAGSEDTSPEPEEAAEPQPAPQPASEPPSEPSLEDLEAATRATLEESREAQRSVNALQSEADRLATTYALRLRELERQQQYNETLRLGIEEAERRQEALGQTLSDLAEADLTLRPALLARLDDLDAFIRLDLPYRQAERRGEIEALRNALADSSRDLAQIMAQVLAAYDQALAEGETSEVFPGFIEDGPRRIAVEFLRVGRLALYRRSLDGAIVQYYDPASDGWRSVPNRFRADLARAYRMVGQEEPLALVILPLPDHRVEGALEGPGS